MKTLLMTVSVASILAIAPALAQDQSPSAPSMGAGTSTKLGEHRVSNLMKATVKNAGGESVGTINDALLDTSGQVTHYIIGVGGFLGIGERNVAVPFGTINISRDANNAVVVATTTPKETLSQLPEWKDPLAAANAPASSPPVKTTPTMPKDQPVK
jgi:sporulation protein YlmC with PRC-barrel domain